MSVADTCTRLDWPTAVLTITCVLIGSLAVVVMVRGWPAGFALLKEAVEAVRRQLEVAR